MTSEPPAADAPDFVLTLAGPGEAELKEKRSRFLAFAWPVRDEADASARIAETGRRHHDARHVCTAWRVGMPPRVTENRNDDGEPGGSAGEPILAEIRKRDLVDVAVAVVRYFGGIKLGTGGLARAYGGAAEAALEATKIRRMRLGREFRLEFPYALQKTLRRQVDLADGRILEESWAADVTWRIWLPHSACAAFPLAVRELTAGRIDARQLTDQTVLD